MMIFFSEAYLQHLHPVTIGIVLAASGAGGALGSAAASWLFRQVEYALLQIQMLVWTVTFAVLFFWGGRSFLFMAGAMAVLGLTGALGNIALDTFVVRHAAETMLARVMSVDRLTSLGALALGPLLGGILFQQFGTQHALLGLFVIAGSLLTVPAIALSAALRRSPV